MVVGLAAIGAGGWYASQQWGGTGATANPGRVSPPVAVEVISARSGTVRESIESIGTARANESMTVTAKQTGSIEKINFNEGELARAGAFLRVR